MSITELPADTQGSRFDNNGKPIRGFEYMDRLFSGMGTTPARRGDGLSYSDAMMFANQQVIRILPSGDLFDNKGKPTSGFEHKDQV